MANHVPGIIARYNTAGKNLLVESISKLQVTAKKISGKVHLTVEATYVLDAATYLIANTDLPTDQEKIHLAFPTDTFGEFTVTPGPIEIENASTANGTPAHPVTAKFVVLFSNGKIQGLG